MPSIWSGASAAAATAVCCCSGHLDTVVHHDAHRPLARDGDRLTGSGAVDMKGGVALALALMRELAERPSCMRRLRCCS